MFHRIVATDRSLGAPNQHVALVIVWDHAAHKRTHHRDTIDQLQELQQLWPCVPRATAHSDDHSLGGEECVDGLPRGVVGRGTQPGRRTHGQLIQAEVRQRARLSVHR